MADTVKHVLNDSSWTNISQGSLNGFLTNEGSKDIFYFESSTTPSDIKGHTLKVGDYISFEIQAGQNIFARSVSGESEVVVTNS